jgi:DNA-binding NarL/FixJ family response regulator
MTRASPIRVLLADDNAHLLDALASLIESDDDLELAAIAADAAEAVELAAAEQPDLALIDVRMPAGGGLAAARGIAARSPRTTLVALSASSVLPEALDAVVSGCIVKGSRIKDIVDSIKLYACGASPPEGDRG